MTAVEKIQAFLAQAGEESKERRVNQGQMTLGQLIAALKGVTARENCLIEFNFSECYPSEINSYRGDYSELAIGFEQSCYPGERPKLSGFIQDLENCVGQEFQGYKGGEFVMDEDTPLWVANYSYCSRAGITGIKTEPEESSSEDPAYNVILVTGYCEY